MVINIKYCPTLDHIYTMSSLINQTLSKKKRLYCAFIDYRKAFDYVDRISLWSKLLNSGISGKIFTVITNIYGDTKSCVRHNNLLSELFSCVIGVRQGENLSPLLFALYLNDLRTYLSNSCPDMEIMVNSGGDTDIYMKLSVLLYADDTILISDTPQDLQKSLNALHDYCNMWKLTINTSKTKIVVFSRGKVKKIPNWHIGDDEIGTQYEYTYLGTAFNYNGRFNKAKAKQVAQAKRALFGLIAKARKLQLPTDIQCHLFDSCIVPVLLYGCEIWGFSDLTQIEQVQNYFCKQILKLPKSTANCMVLGELGRTPLEVQIIKRVLNFWIKLATGKTSKLSSVMYCILRHSYDYNIYKDKWLQFIHSQLNQMGLGYLWDDISNVNLNWFKSLIDQKLVDIWKQKWTALLSENSHCTNYKIFKNKLEHEPYLLILDPSLSIPMCKYRCGNHKLPMVIGRYNNVPRNERICKLCTNQNIADEFHYVFECNFFANERKKYLDAKFRVRPNVFKMEQLFTTSNKTRLIRLATFVKLIMKAFN